MQCSLEKIFIINQTHNFMKHLILLFALSFMMQDAFASGSTIANSWRWSADEGSISEKADDSWLKPVNVAPVISMPGAYRLRVLNSSGGAYTFVANDRLVLQYREEPQPNSASYHNAEGYLVNNTSPTAGDWITIESEDPEASENAFAVDENYDDTVDGGLVDRNYTSAVSANLLYTNESGGGAISPARYEPVTSFTRRGALGLSKNSSIGFGDVTTGTQLSGILAGGFEIEYRLVVTKNAKPGSVYYFRLFNVNKAGSAAGTTDSWDYAAGFPSVAISRDFNGAVNTDLPDISVGIDGISNSLQFAAGESKSTNLYIANSSAGVPSTTDFAGSLTLPSGWTVSVGTITGGSGFALNTSTGAFTGGSSIIEGEPVVVPLTITAPSGAGASGGTVTFTLGNVLEGKAGGDRNLVNNRVAVTVYKPQ